MSSNQSDSDLEHHDPAEAKKSYRQIMEEETTEGVRAFRQSGPGLFLSALAAGLDIGFSLLLMAVLWTKFHATVTEGVLELLKANAYAIGFIFVVLGRSELFTEHTTLAVLPVLHRRAGVLALARLWIVIYVGNVLGTAGFAGLLVLTGPMLGFIEVEALGEIARPAVAHAGEAIFLSGLLAGWLMGLLSWLVTAARDTISQIVIVWLITFVIGIAHLAHPIVGSVEVLAGLFARQGVSWGNYGHFLLWATLGTAVGGTFFVALLKFSYGVVEQTASTGQPEETQSHERQAPNMRRSA